MASVSELEALGYTVTESMPETDERRAVYNIAAEGISLSVGADELLALTLPAVAAGDQELPARSARSTPPPPPVKLETLLASLDPAKATVADVIAAARQATALPSGVRTV